MLQEIFKIGNLSVSGYLFFYSLGALFCSLFIFILARKEKFDAVETANFIIFGFISMLCGSKLYGLIYIYFSNPEYYNNNLDKLFKQFSSGGVFYGGLIVGIIFALLYLPKFFKGKELNMLDIVAIGGALGHSFGRIGCFMGGCCYGKVSDLPWAVKIPFLAGKMHPYCNNFVHPTQIYESILNLINFILLYFIFVRKKFDGQIVSLYLINYGLIRIFVEFFRNDGVRGYLFKGSHDFLSFSYPQLISSFFILSGIILYKVKKKQKLRKNDLIL